MVDANSTSPKRNVSHLRIGTWNLAGRWTEAHRDFTLALDCDLLLLTEVSERLALPGFFLHKTTNSMAANRRWAAVASRAELVPLDDPHPATAMAHVGAWTVASSILPWRSAPNREPWLDAPHAEKTVAAVDTLSPLLSPSKATLIWGGDWNHALHGPETAGSMKGRARIVTALDDLRLSVPTARLPHRLDGLLTIDHVAVPSSWHVITTERVPAVDGGGKRLSDHDAYVVDVEPHSTPRLR
jgi:hypothetical protein